MFVPVTILKGVKAARAAQLAQLGVHSIDDLHALYPKSYEDRSLVRSIQELRAGEAVTVYGVVQSVESHQIGKAVTLTTIRLRDESGILTISIFNGRYPAPPIHMGDAYAFYGRITKDQYGCHMTNPSFTKYTDHWDTEFFRIQPVYPLTKGLTQHILRKITAEALRIAPPAYETLPIPLLKKYGLMARGEALRNVHFPDGVEKMLESRKRLKFEELFTMQFLLLLLKETEDGIQNGTSFKSDNAQRGVSALLSALPFELTEAQQHVWREISANMDEQKAMNRLVLGDVGSGKTVLAVLAMVKAICAGYQAVYMAPTEILAEQHYYNVLKMLTPLGIRTVLITGSLTAKEKREALTAVASGEAQCVIGTHALIQPSVQYAKLGIAITDEQHRFGVKQRAMLAEAGATPDVLVMTATPIPRTLALILYGDMDISVLKALPKGRKPIKTFALENTMHERIYKWILTLVEEGRQVYMVYPVIEEGEASDLKSASESFEILSKSVFAGIPCALIHGRMPSSQKENVMRSFTAGEIKILFSTTVVEVGVDVPNASLMVVENAERFGLAQLHQLRGRVGRGDYQSFCVLFSERITERMKIMQEVSDGFVLSEKDLELRGPGDFFGVEQHGLPPFKIANLYEDADLLKLAGEGAYHVLQNRSEYVDFIEYISKKYPGRIPL